MTIEQTAELIQQIVKNGTVRGKDTLDKAYYEMITYAARDSVLFSNTLDKNKELFTRMRVTAPPRDYEIKNGKVELPEGFNVQGINGVAGLTKDKEVAKLLMMPVSSGEQYLVADTFFTYYVPSQREVSFVNLPNNVKYLRIHSIAGSHVDDDVSNDVVYLIIKDVVTMLLQSEEVRPDTSADNNAMDDYIKNQIKQFINAPNNAIS
jgi:hypothetical protein